jgi:DNA-binding beta-propeller fold protein YncE
MATCALVGVGTSCSSCNGAGTSPSQQDAAAPPNDAAAPVKASLPLIQVADVALPGRATRFDYQDIDTARGHLVIAHMNDGEVLIVDLRDGSVLKRLTGIPTARGVVVADDVGRIFVTSSPNQVVIIDNTALIEVGRVTTGTAPDGIGWDPTDKIVGVSDQGDGAISLIPNSGNGTRTAIPLGAETGNVVFDAPRGRFWITVVSSTPPDQLVAVDPVAAKVVTTIGLPGCDGAHGLRIHPDGKSALIACENNDRVARVELLGANTVSTAATGSGPDVLSIDPGLGWLYIAAESGDLTVFDINQPGVVLIGHDSPGDNSHSVAADPATHRVFFPLMSGPDGTPVLRIMHPSGT